MWLTLESPSNIEFFLRSLRFCPITDSFIFAFTCDDMLTLVDDMILLSTSLMYAFVLNSKLNMFKYVKCIFVLYNDDAVEFLFGNGVSCS